MKLCGAACSRKKSIYRRIAFLSLGVVFLLSGCSDAFEETAIKAVGIMDDEEYEKYIELKDTGQLDQSGYYMYEGIEVDEGTEDDEEAVPAQEGIHVTFARNAYLDIGYFLDADLKNPVDVQACYLRPGDCIYASDPVCNHPASNWYCFDRFCIREYDEEGHRGQELVWQEEGSSGNLVLCVPADYEGTEVSVEPLGKYENHSISLKDYCIDSTGQKEELPGTWVINEEETTGRLFEVSPVEALAVDYKYDPQEFCYVSSVPDSFYHENGLVRFETVAADSNIEEYLVELRSIKGEYSFDPSEYPAENGKVTFKYRNSVITERRSIPDGEAIDYVAEPDLGYQHPKGTGQIIVDASNPEQTDEKIRQAIRFYVDEMVDVILPQPDGGRIEYVVDGEILAGETCSLRCGTVITMNFFGWNGWICGQSDGAEYTVTDQKVNQIVSIQGGDINSDIFKESDQHKPVLNIVVKDSLTEALFEVSASGIREEKIGYGTGNKTTILPDWVGQTDRLIFEDKVGTEDGIILGITNDMVLAGDALKLEVMLTDTGGKEEKHIEYITKLPAEHKIVLYDEDEIADSSKVYKEVLVTASKVNVVTYDPKTIECATLEVFLDEDKKALEKGDVLETSRDVAVSVTPQKGYVVTGSKTDDGIYSDTMKFSKWEKDWEKIMEDHPVRKLWHVTLDTSDEYGECVFKVDGEEVSGTVEVYEGQELTVEYTLTESGYQIDRSGIDRFIGGVFHKNTDKETIPVSEEIDGKVIKRSDYITVREKGDK